MKRRVAGALALAAVVVLLPLGGCGGKGGPREVPPAVVSVAQVTEGEYVEEVDFTGRTEAVETVEVKARATGYLTQVLFTEGEHVEEGQQLYQIDDRTYKADLAKQLADVKNYQAQLENATSKLGNASRMRVGGAIAREEYDALVAAKESAGASLAAAGAAADRARLALSFTKVYSPIPGIVGKTSITKGNLVTQDQTTLTTVVRSDRVYAYFNVDERTVLRFREMIRRQELTSYREGFFPVYVGTQAEKGFPHVGRIDFVDNRIDPSTGTLRVRGVFPPVALKRLTWSGLEDAYPPTTLVPGLFVRVRLPVGTATHRAVLVSDAAIGSIQAQKFVYVVGQDNKVEERLVSVGPLRGGLRVIESGLRPGEWIIVAGLQRVRPGVTVQPNKVPMPAGDDTGPDRAAGK